MALIDQILNYSVCGISVATIIGLVIYVIRYAITAKKEIQVTKQSIEEAFKNVVLPKDLRINLSSKIDPAIKEALEKYLEPITKAYNKIALQNQLMLSIMSKFSHAEKLTEEEQKLLHDLINGMGSSEINL